MNKLSIIFIILICFFISAYGFCESIPYLLPGDSKSGGEIFFEKGCIKCHSIFGEGGKTAPDIGKTPGTHLSAARIAGVMWNHAPRMWEEMEGEGVDIPRLLEKEMADLFAFLYSIRYFDEPGDPAKGKEVMASKGCSRCHSIHGEGERLEVPDIGKWARYVNPVHWAQVMWNHAPNMKEAMEEKGIRWPEFKEDEVVDLLAYIRESNPESEERIYLPPADPKAGKGLFVDKGCSKCHAIYGEGGKGGPDLGKREDMPRRLTQLAGLMWNHSPRMLDEMKKEKMEYPQFSSSEMADLIAYLYSVRYFDEPGDAGAGGKVFKEKSCAMCHSNAGEKEGARDLTKWRGSVSPIMMSGIMWNHGPEMLKMMKEKGIPWPEFKGKEMVDLIEYLNR